MEIVECKFDGSFFTLTVFGALTVLRAELPSQTRPLDNSVIFEQGVMGITFGCS